MASTTNVADKYNDTIGVIQSAKQVAPYKRRLTAGVPWCLDNGVFTGRFEKSAWLDELEVYREYADTCLFVVVPDVVGDCAKTIKRFGRYRDLVEGYPVAFVAQDGIQEHAASIPWDEFDCLFIGGTDEHKLGSEGGWILNEAKNRGKWVHVGRVNSASRIRQFWQSDSWDGTHLSFEPRAVKKIHSAVLEVRSMKRTRGLFDGQYGLGGNNINVG